MQILSSYPTNNIQSESKSATVSNAEALVTASGTENKSKEDTADAIKTFSTRAEKFSQLNKEFDITGVGFKITDSFIKRLGTLEILTTSQATKLSSDLKFETKSTDSISNLKTDINSIIKRVEGETGTASLISVLEKSQKILDNLDGSKSKDYPINPSTAAAELGQFLNGDTADILTDKEKDSVKDLRVALSIADRLNPGQSASAEVGKYIEIQNRFRYT